MPTLKCRTVQSVLPKMSSAFAHTRTRSCCQFELESTRSELLLLLQTLLLRHIQKDMKDGEVGFVFGGCCCFLPLVKLNLVKSDCICRRCYTRAARTGTKHWTPIAVTIMSCCWINDAFLLGGPYFPTGLQSWIWSWKLIGMKWDEKPPTPKATCNM